MVRPIKITPRQDKWLLEYMKCDNMTEAWMRIYEPSCRECARAASAKAIGKPHVKRRLDELRERAMKKSDISIDKVLTDLQWAIDMGDRFGQSAGQAIGRDRGFQRPGEAGRAITGQG